MKFHFCGGSDAPDWILTEVAVISKFSAVRMKLLCREVVAKLLDKNNEFNYERIRKVMTSKHFNFELGDIKAIIAALRFIMNNGAKYNLTSKILSTELEQIGMPRDTSRVICGSLQTHKDEIRSHFVIETLHLPRLVKTEWRTDFILSSSILDNVSLPFVRMNLALSTNPPFFPYYTLIKNQLNTLPNSTKKLQVPITKQEEDNNSETKESIKKTISDSEYSFSFSFEMTAEKFNLLFHELKTARALFDQKM